MGDKVSDFMLKRLSAWGISGIIKQSVKSLVGGIFPHKDK